MSSPPKILLAALYSALCSFPLTSPAREWHVSFDGSGDAPTVRAAMDSAQAGDEIVVGPGTYTWSTENTGDDHSMIQLKRDVILRSEAGPESTILDAEELGRVVLFLNAGKAGIDGFTVQNGVAINLPTEQRIQGGGIYSTGDSRPDIRNCIVRDNRAATGGGIFCDEGGAFITQCEIINNSARFGGGGGGLYIFNTVVFDCVIRDNYGFPKTGGLFAADCTLTNCIIESNRTNGQSGGSGGGAKAVGTTTFTGCVFRNNRASGPSVNGYGGGLLASWTCVVRSCVFVGNTVTGGSNALGAAIAVFTQVVMSDLTVENCTFVGNTATAPNVAVAGIYSNSNELTTGRVTSSIIAWNTGAATLAGSLEFSCTNTFGNTNNEITGIDGGGNFNLDPQFCAVDPVASVDFSLQNDSPCAPGNHPSSESCGLIGTGLVQCESVGVESRTWGEIKSLFR